MDLFCFNKVFSILKEKVIFDGRNLYDLEQMAEYKCYYNSIGRKTIDTRETKKTKADLLSQ